MNKIDGSVVNTSPSAVTCAYCSHRNVPSGSTMPFSAHLYTRACDARPNCWLVFVLLNRQSRNPCLRIQNIAQPCQPTPANDDLLGTA